MVTLLGAIVSIAVQAQATAVAQISGTVQDVSGAAIAGAEIRTTQTDTAASRTVTSGADGTYVVSNLPVGPYRIEIRKEGFNAYVQSGIVLQVNSDPSVNAVMKVGAVNETIEVTAGAAMIETHETSLGQVIDQQRIAELPLNGRQAMQLIALSGAAVDLTGATGGLVTVRNQPSAVSVSVAGGGSNFTTYALDGGNSNDPLTNVSLPFPFPDALREFSVQTSAVPARFGVHPGASVNAVTRSGTNQFHGVLFEFLRNGDFNGRNFFAAKRDTLRRNQFGGTLGGPVVKNKLFFFYGYQGTINRSDPAATTAFVVTPNELAGDFSGAASAGCNANKAVALKAPFIGNQIASSLLNPAAVKLATQYLPSSADPCGKVLYGIPQRDTENQNVARVDYQQSSKNMIFGRYFVVGYGNPPYFDGKNALTTTQVGLLDRAQNATVSDTYLLGANAVNSVHASFARGRVNRSDPDNFFTPCDLGVNISCLVPKYSSFAVTNFFNIGGTSPGPFNSNALQLTEDLDVVKGNHQFAVGVNWIHTQLNAHSNITGNGNFTFTGLTTGSAIGDFLIGRPASFVQSAEQQVYERSNYFGAYFQDSWKVTHRLTVNYGLRWEPHIQQTNIQGRVAHFSLDGFLASQVSTVFPNAPAGRTFPGDKGFPGNAASANSWRQFAPRIGIVFDPRGQGKEKISVAYGIFYDLPLIYYMAHFPTDPPWGTNTTVNNPIGGLTNPWQGVAGGNIFPTPNPPPANVGFGQFGSYDNLPAKIRPTMVQHWNVSMQKQFSGDWLLSATYLGNQTSHLWLAHDVNQATYVPGNCVAGQYGLTVAGPCSTTGNINFRRFLYGLNPVRGSAYGSVLEVDDGATANYHGVLVSAQHRFSQGFTALVNYTWSHCLSEGEEGMNIANNYQDPGNRRANYGNCASDKRGIFNSSIVATSPKFGSHLVQQLAGDWQLSTILTASSGAPLTLTSGVQNSLTGAGSDRPLQTGDSSATTQTFNSWFNPGAFVANPVGTYGNVGRGALRGPGPYSVTLAVVRRIKIRERVTAELRAEAFNVLNHANGTTVATSFTSPQFGKVTAAAEPRILQLGMKLAF